MRAGARGNEPPHTNGSDTAEAPLTTSLLSRRRVAPADEDDATTGAARVLRPRRGLPGSRAVVGGLLVTVAGLLAWWSAAAGDRVDAEPVVVAAHDVGPGERLGPDDVRVVSMAVPDQLAGSTFARPGDLEGAVALGPIGAGELVQASVVGGRAGGSADAGAAEISFPVEPDWALGASLRAGDRVDLFATYGTGPAARTIRVLRGATIRRAASEGGGDLGGEASLVVTIGLGAQADAAAVVNASRAASVTLVRTTGTGGAPGGDEFVLADPVAVAGDGSATPVGGTGAAAGGR